MKVAIMILSDPKAGAEESLGRLFNALAAAYDFQQAGDDITILFNGTGTRWLHPLSQAGHPAYELFEQVKDKVAGASCGCAEVFGASQEVEQTGFELIKDNPVPGTSGVSSLRNLANQGYQVLTF